MRNKASQKNQKKIQYEVIYSSYTESNEEDTSINYSILRKHLIVGNLQHQGSH